MFPSPVRTLALLATLCLCLLSEGRATEALRLLAAPGSLHSDEVTLVWDKVEASGSPVLYQLFRDGTPVGQTRKTHLTLKGLQPGHAQSFTLQAHSGPVTRRSEPLTLHTPAAETVLSVLDFGAKGDGTTLNTKALQAAIDACPANGVVLIPKGVFLSGALFLKSDMTLLIASGGVLKGSANPSDYEPFYLNRFEGWELRTYASLLNAGRLDRSGPANVRNLSIRGEGTLSGGGKALGMAMWTTGGERSRGRLVCLMNCSNVEIQGLRIEESPSWTLHYIYSENVSLHGLRIHSDVRNGDGIDPDSSKNSYIFNCSFDTGDDCIAIKSGKNPEGNVVNRPTENVQVFDCVFTRGHGISIGSEMSGGVRGVLVQDCIAGDLLNGMQIKATKDRGNVIEDVVVRDCDLQKITILTRLNYNNDGAAAPEQPFFSNFRFVNIDLSKAPNKGPVIIVNGFPQPGHRTANVLFENICLPKGGRIQVDEAEDVRFVNVLTADGGKPAYEVTKSERIQH
jgi:polygalacturonase